MIRNEIHTYQYSDGCLQKVQKITLDSFSRLRPFQPSFSNEAFQHLADLYEQFIIPSASWYFGQLIFYCLPDDVEIPFSSETEDYGTLYEPLTAVTADFRENIDLHNGKLFFRSEETERFFNLLKEKGCLRTVSGKRKKITLFPVGKHIGFMSSTPVEAKIMVNSSFFLMDVLDIGSVYDQLGTPIGMTVFDGKILTPPLFAREVFAVDGKGKSSVRHISIKDITVRVDNREYRDGINARFFTRDISRRTPIGGCDLVIIGNRVVAVKPGGNSEVCSSGFVLHSREMIRLNSREVAYSGIDDIMFAIQVGNSAVVNGKKTEGFTSRFYNMFEPWENSYPPSRYPLNYHKDRAPRIILGADASERPVILWLEGAGKFGYQKGKDSSGASLWEAAEIAGRLGLVNAVHLDGGGSAQILLQGSRKLKISDRSKTDFSEKERAVPRGLAVL